MSEFLRELTDSDITTNGYYRLPGGLILQWGSESSSNTSGTVTFPTAFPTACLFCNASDSSSSSVNVVKIGTDPGATGFDWYAAVNDGAHLPGLFKWFAIGH